MTSVVHSDSYPAIDPTKVNLNGRAVFVSGGSKGIGRETVLSFARAGVSRLAVGARSDLSSLEKDIQAAAKEGGKQAPQFLPLKIDIASRSSVEQAAKEVEQAFGSLDIIVNNAAYFPKVTPITESDPDSWWNTWEVNIHGTYLICRTFIPLLLKGTLKTIVNVASVGAHLVGPGLSAYQTSKLAILRFGEFIAKEYADDGIVCFAIHPGNIPTELTGDEIPKGWEHIFCDTTRLPADTVVYLSSQKPDWLSGRYINCTWDMPELEAKKEEIVKGDKLKVKFDF